MPLSVVLSLHNYHALPQESAKSSSLFSKNTENSSTLNASQEMQASLEQLGAFFRQQALGLQVE